MISILDAGTNHSINILAFWQTATVSKGAGEKRTWPRHSRFSDGEKIDVITI